MIVVDIETTGTNPREDFLVSIGALDFFNPHNQFYGECQVPHGAVISPTVRAIIGFSDEELCADDKQSPKALLAEFLQWTSSAGHKILAGHNTSFDRDFLIATAQRENIEWPFGYRTLDLHSLGYAHMLGRHVEIPIARGRPDVHSDLIFEYVGLPVRTGSHNALDDTKLEAESFSRLINGAQLLDDYHEFAVPEYLRT